jgi:hypothetical protein
MNKTNSLEQTINHAIANGARIAEGGLGTIFATGRQLAAADKFADKQAAQRDKAAASKLSDCTRRVVGGEVRYYANETKFAVMSRSNVVRWFEVRKDGIYAAK